MVTEFLSSAFAERRPGAPPQNACSTCLPTFSIDVNGLLLTLAGLIETVIVVILNESLAQTVMISSRSYVDLQHLLMHVFRMGQSITTIMWRWIAGHKPGSNTDRKNTFTYICYLHTTTRYCVARIHLMKSVHNVSVARLSLPQQLLHWGLRSTQYHDHCN